MTDLSPAAAEVNDIQLSYISDAFESEYEGLSIRETASSMIRHIVCYYPAKEIRFVFGNYETLKQCVYSFLDSRTY